MLTDWDLTGISEETLLIDRIIHCDILDIGWKNFRAADELDRDFKEAGFSNVTVHFDRHRVFPTVVADKA